MKVRSKHVVRDTFCRTSEAMRTKEPYPFLVDVPMLHGVRHVRSLYKMFNHNRSLAIHTSTLRASFVVNADPFSVLKSFGPSRFAEVAVLSVKDIGCDDRVHDQLKNTGRSNQG